MRWPTQNPNVQHTSEGGALSNFTNIEPQSFRKQGSGTKQVPILHSDAPFSNPRGLSCCNDHLYFACRENPVLASVDQSCFPARATASRVTWQEAVVPQVSDTSWGVKYSAFTTVRAWGVGRVNETKISYMLWSIIKCMGSRCFLLIQLSLKSKKFLKKSIKHRSYRLAFQ